MATTARFAASAWAAPIVPRPCLIDKFGADHIAIGTDYPADMGEDNPVEHVYQIEGLSEADREKICGLNALRLMNLDEARFRTADAA